MPSVCLHCLQCVFHCAFFSTSARRLPHLTAGRVARRRYPKGAGQLNTYRVQLYPTALQATSFKGGVELESNPARNAVTLHIIEIDLSTLRAPSRSILEDGKRSRRPGAIQGRRLPRRVPSNPGELGEVYLTGLICRDCRGYDRYAGWIFGLNRSTSAA